MDCVLSEREYPHVAPEGMTLGEGGGVMNEGYPVDHEEDALDDCKESARGTCNNNVWPPIV